MKRIVSFIVVLAVAMCGMTQVMAQKSITKEAKKVEREIKKQERLAQDAVEGQEEFNAAVQAINNQSFVLEANNIQPMNGPFERTGVITYANRLKVGYYRKVLPYLFIQSGVLELLP